ncbi:hypothetical protein GCM10009753_46280 [Streptantibioticus ferralitis]
MVFRWRASNPCALAPPAPCFRLAPCRVDSRLLRIAGARLCTEHNKRLRDICTHQRIRPDYSVSAEVCAEVRAGVVSGSVCTATSAIWQAS